MGAKFGKALYVEAAVPFVNLPHQAVDDLWESWNDVAEGFGVDKEEANEIFTVLQEVLDMPKKPLASLTELMFDVYDTDNNKLNDALEMIGSLAVASGMRFLQKLNFLFTMYDFDESGELSIDEMTLALKSTAVGLSKITDDVPPTEEECEALAHDALLGCGKTLQDRITRHEFLAFCRRSKEIRNWIYTYDDSVTVLDASDAGGLAGGAVGSVEGFTGMPADDARVLQIREEGALIDRTVAEVAALEPDFFITSDLYTTVATNAQQAESVAYKGGDHFKASMEVRERQWVQLLDSVAPNMEIRPKDGPPEYAVTLNWVYGYKARGGRNTLWYTHTHELCYPSGSILTLFSRERNSQEHLMGHSDEIMSLAVHAEPGFTRMATGEMGVRPKIIVWDLISMQATHTTKGFHQRGITHIGFNPDGSKVVSVGADAGHSVAVHFLAKDGTMQMLFSSMTHRNKVLAAAFLTNERFMTGGCQHMYFWDPSEVNSVTSKSKALFGRAGVHTITAACPHPSNTVDGGVTGTASGKILVWKGRNLERIINAHERPVTVVKCVPSVGLVTAGLDSRIRIWFPDITPGLLFDLKHLGSFNPIAQSLDWDYPNNKILIGTFANEVYEVSDTDGSDLNGGPLIQTHFAGEVHGLAAHPIRDEFVTVGDDGTVRVFDLVSHRLLRMTRLDGPCRCVTYSPDGTRLAIGMGAPEPETPYNHYEAAATLGGDPPGAANSAAAPTASTGIAASVVGASIGGGAAVMTAPRPNKNGAFVILDETEMTVVHEARDSKAWIRSVAWSPDSQTLAVGSSDMDTYLYYTSDWSAKGKCRGSKFGVSAIDFSADSAYLRTACYGPGQDAVGPRGIGGGLAPSGVSAVDALADQAKHRPFDGMSRRKAGAGAGGGGRGAGAAGRKKRENTDHPGYQILFWDASTGEPLRSLIVLKEVDWATTNCPLAWEVQGCWPGAGKGLGDGMPAIAGGTVLDRAMRPDTPSAMDATQYAERFLEVRSTVRSNAGDTLAAIDEYGMVRLARYPWLDPKAPCHLLRGHSTSGSKVAFTTGDGFLLTAGARDRCIMQWALELLPAEMKQSGVATKVLEDEKAGDSDDDEDDDSIDEEMSREDDFYVRDAATEAAYNQDMRAAYQLDVAIAKGRGTDPITTKPWHNTAHPPTEPPPIDLSQPPENLRLEWVHGYRAQDVRNNIAYNSKLEILFPAGSVAVTMKAQEDGSCVQRHFLEHTDDILCLRMHPVGKMVATGQVGRVPKLVVWDSHTMVTQSVCYGHYRGVSHCAFAPLVDGLGGHLVASVGLDADHSVIVHDWRSGDVVARCKGVPQKTFDISWSPEGDEVVVCGLNHVTFYKLDGMNLVPRRAVMGGKGQLGRMMCIAWAAKDCVIGTGSGKLYRFKDNQLQKVLNAHTGSITCCWTCRAGIATGGRDGTVKLWSSTLDMQRSFDVSVLDRCLVPSVRGLSWDPTGNRIVLGTAGSEIYEISSLNGMDINSGPLLQGHFQGELWALATHPTKGECITIGDDQTVRVWDLATRTIIGSTDLDAAGRAVAYSPDAIRIAIGLGGKPLPPSTKVKLDGGYMILDSRDLSIVHEGRDSKEWITDIKYSKDGHTLAVASQDSKIYLYDIPGAYSLKGVFSQHNTFITSLDFSSDGTYLQSNDGSLDLLFSNDAAEYIAHATSLVDVKWATQTCPLGWSVKGVWPTVNDGTVVHSVDRSREGSALVAADNFGRLKMVRFPCPDQAALGKTYAAHTGGSQRVRWAANDTHVMSIGKHDRCLFQWRVVRDKADDSTPSGKEADDPDLLKEFAALPDDELAVDEPTFDAVKPWVSSCIPPSRVQKPHPSPPPQNLVIDWVHGYRTDHCRSNLFYNQAGDMVYSTAALGVVYSPVRHAQAFYEGHNGREIGPLTVDFRGRYAATGEVGFKPRVHVWDALTGQAVIRLPIFHRRGVCLLAFSAGPAPKWKPALPTTAGMALSEGSGSGGGGGGGGAGAGAGGGEGEEESKDDILIGSKAGLVGAGGADGCARTDGAGWDDQGYRLISVGLDRDHTMAVWRSADGTWSDAKFVASAPTSKEKVLFAAFIGSTNNSPCDIVTGGVRHVTFWQLQGRNLVPYNGVFGHKGRIQPVVSAAVYDKKLVTGTATGHLYVWTDRMVSRAVSAHEKTVNSLSSSGDVLISGSKDGTIKVWGNGADLAMLAQFDLKEARPKPYNASISSVFLLPDKHRSVILIGTRSAETYELSRLTGRMVQMSTAHCTDHVWGLAMHPIDPDLYVTTGDDKTVRLWSLSKHRQLAMVVLENHMRAVTWSPDGTILAVGYGGRVGEGRSRRDGAFVLLKAVDLSLLHEGQDSRDWVTDLKFSPDGSQMALASEDSKVYLYSLAKRPDSDDISIRLAAKCEMSNTAVRQVDFDSTSTFLQTCDLQGEYIFYTTEDGERVTHPSELRDVEWASYTSVYGYSVLGAWPEVGTDVTAADRNRSFSLVASGEDTGRVKLFRYPAATPKCAHRTAYGHSATLTKVRFSEDSRYLVSTGGADRTIIQWRLDVDPDNE